MTNPPRGNHAKSGDPEPMSSKEVPRVQRGLAVVLLAAGVTRLAGLLSFPLLCTTDSDGYYHLAVTLTSSEGFAHFNGERTPLYPLFLACCFNLFGESPMGVAIVQAVLGMAGVGFLYAAIRRVSSEPVAIVASLIIAGHPLLLVLGQSMLTESLTLPLLSLFLFAFVKWLDTPDGPRALALGLVGGLLLLCRPSSTPFILAALLALLCLLTARAIRVKDIRIGKAVQPCGLFLLGVAIVCGPWMIVMKHHTGRFGLSFLTGRAMLMYSVAKGFYEGDDPEMQHLCPDFGAILTERPYSAMWCVTDTLEAEGWSTVEIDDWCRVHALAAWRAQPGKYAREVGMAFLYALELRGNPVREAEWMLWALVRDPQKRSAEDARVSWRYLPSEFRDRPTTSPLRHPLWWIHTYGYRYRWIGYNLAWLCAAFFLVRRWLRGRWLPVDVLVLFPVFYVAAHVLLMIHIDRILLPMEPALLLALAAQVNAGRRDPAKEQRS